MLKDRPILFLALGQTLVWAALYYSFPALLLRWELDLGWSKPELTAAITIAIVMSALCAPLAGRIIDRGQGAVMMAASAVGGGLLLIGLSAIAQLWQFYALWALIGVMMAGCLYDPCFALVTRARGAGAKRGIIVITLFAGFAGTISFPAAHSLGEAFGWRITLIVYAAVVMGVAAPLLWLGAKEMAGVEDESPDGVAQVSSRHGHLKSPVFWCLGLGIACFALVHGTALHHLLPLLNDRGLSPELAVLAASFIGPMQVAGRLTMMATERFTSHHSLTLCSLSFIILAILCLSLAGASVVFVTLFVVMFGGSFGALTIMRPLIARDLLGGRNFGAKSGALALLYQAGAASAPYLGALVWTLGGYGLVLKLLVAIGVTGLALYVLAWRRVTVT